MPVNLRELPDKLTPPPFPGKVRWFLLVVLCTATGFGLTLLFHTGEQWSDPTSFWGRALALPLILGLFLYGLRLLAHETREAYVTGWNRARSEVESQLVDQGRQPIALLASSYCTAGGSEHLAASLRTGSKPLQTVFLPLNSTTMRWSPLVDPQPYPPEAYAQRVEMWLERVLAAPAVDVNRLFPGQPVQVRIRHNALLADEDVIKIWQCCAQRKGLNIESVRAASSEDGLLWLDNWLDQENAFPLVLSVEFSLFDRPVADQAESMSVVLLARSGFCQAQGLRPSAWIHRPVAMTVEPQSLREVLLWGRVAEEGLPFTWQAQVPAPRLHEMSMALAETGRALANDACLCLDETLGAPGSAVGNLSLIVAGEQASSDKQPQLLMVQDVTPQWCIVQPVL